MEMTRVCPSHAAKPVSQGYPVLWFIWEILEIVSPHGYTIPIVPTTTLPERTLSEGLFPVRLKAEQLQTSHHGFIVAGWYYEVVPIAPHRVRVTPFIGNYGSC
jgi:hypothetical protein